MLKDEIRQKVAWRLEILLNSEIAIKKKPTLVSKLTENYEVNHNIIA